MQDLVKPLAVAVQTLSRAHGLGIKWPVQALSEASIQYDPSLVALGANERDGASAALTGLLGNPSPPTALFSSDARCTMVLVSVMQHLGSTLAVVGFGDFPMADAVRPAMTVIEQDPANLGRHAINRILERTNEPSRRFRRKTVLPLSLIERGSCLADGV